MNKQVGKRHNHGFTLVELLVVIAIIGVLASLVLLQLGIARGKSRDTKRIADISQIRSAIELYFDDDNGRYPDSADMSVLKTRGYIVVIPSDPLVGTACGNTFSGTVIGDLNCYAYAWDPNINPIRYHLWTELEYSNTAALKGDYDIDSTGWSGAPIEGGDEIDCNDDTPQDCIYDVGQR